MMRMRKCNQYVGKETDERGEMKDESLAANWTGGKNCPMQKSRGEHGTLAMQWVKCAKKGAKIEM